MEKINQLIQKHTNELNIIKENYNIESNRDNLTDGDRNNFESLIQIKAEFIKDLKSLKQC